MKGSEERAGHDERGTEAKRTLELPDPKGHAIKKAEDKNLRLISIAILILLTYVFSKLFYFLSY